MKSNDIKTLVMVLATLVVVSCSGDKKKRVDYHQFKTAVEFTPAR
ncbi:hypothetical protein [Chryseobacterium sp. StRB126]|nr:hypothetical protein [Chryseobacterium sp. StRB126]